MRFKATFQFGYKGRLTHSIGPLLYPTLESVWNNWRRLGSINAAEVHVMVSPI